MVTDAEDQADVFDNTTTPISLYNDLLALKGGPKLLTVLGVIVPSEVDDPYCARDDGSKPIKIEEFISLAQGKKFSLCSPNYGEELTKFGDEIQDKIERKIYLSKLPKRETIFVNYGNYVVPEDPHIGWTYDPRENAIVLAKDIKFPKQPDGSKLEVRFEPFEF